MYFCLRNSKSVYGEGYDSHRQAVCGPMRNSIHGHVHFVEDAQGFTLKI